MVDDNNDEAWRLSSLAQLGSVTWLGLAAQQLGCLYLAGWLVGLAQLVSTARLGQCGGGDTQGQGRSAVWCLSLE